MSQSSPYTCSMYREEMQLLALKRRLDDASLEADERRDLEREIEALEHRMGLD
ncbi:MAG: hypothetical protein P8010_13145 [Desulfosarcinaceae bacterium]